MVVISGRIQAVHFLNLSSHKFSSLKSFLPLDIAHIQIDAKTSLGCNLMGNSIPELIGTILTHFVKIGVQLLKVGGLTKNLIIATQPKFKIADYASNHSFLALVSGREVDLYVGLENVGVYPYQQIFILGLEHHVLVYHEVTVYFCQLLACFCYCLGQAEGFGT